ncbi:MAG: hypothetical protein KDK23_12570 [Leptospiraceae bacterium]|nr:hypothetical protein [Leptospiraceae bacterium]
MERQSDRDHISRPNPALAGGAQSAAGNGLENSGTTLMVRALTSLIALLALISLWIHLNSMGLGPVFPWLGLGFAMHLLAILAFIGSFLVFFTRLRGAPAAMRSSSIRFLVNGRPKWILVPLAIALLYGIVNFLFLAWIPLDPSRAAMMKEATEVDGETLMELRAFSGHWMLFFLAAVYLLWPSTAFRNAGAPSADKAASVPGLAAPGPATSYSRRVKSRSLQSRIWEGSYGFVLGWTAFLSAIFFIGAALSSEWFLIIPGVMFAIATYANYRFRKKRMSYFILAIEIQDSNVVIDYLDQDRRESIRCARPQCLSLFHEEVIRGNSLFGLEIRAGSGVGAHLSEAGRNDSWKAEGAGRLIQFQCKDWPYEELESIHERLKQAGEIKEEVEA